jgi:DNA-binding response OmpR family regulator
MLFEQNGTIISRSSLMTHLWQNDSYVDENTLSVNINRLRKKCELIGLNDFIVTKKGLGYIVE